jgi:3-phosphoglycerate kinase
VILGGAKVHDKIPLLNNMIDKVDEIIVGGGVSYTFLKKVYGMEIGMSLFDKTGFEQIDAILEKVTL